MRDVERPKVMLSKHALTCAIGGSFQLAATADQTEGGTSVL
jgi:hypothetical protein